MFSDTDTPLPSPSERRADLESLATSPLTVPSDIPVSDLIDRFQEENQELALVVDTAGERVVGLVTATDAFEAIAGDIEDPLD